MNKTELLTALSVKFSSVAPEDKWITVTHPNIASSYTPFGLQVISIPVLEINGDVKSENNVLVITDGTNYSWRNSEPGTNNFIGRLNAFISSKIKDNTIQFGKVVDYQIPTSKATVQVYMPDNSAKLLLVTETTPNTFTYKVIG